MLKLRELRIEKGVSQEEVADALNVKNYTIGNWERNRAEPNMSAIIELANYFGCTTDYLLGRENDFGIVNVETSLSSFQNKLLEVVDKLSRDDQFQVLGFAQALSN